MTHGFDFVSNDADDLHCLQATARMALQMLTGDRLDMKQADELTGFVANRETWPFQMMLGMAERGLTVHNIEDFDPNAFIRNPQAEILRQVRDPQIADSIHAMSDYSVEVARVHACMDHPDVTFVRQTPTLDDLASHTRRIDTVVICNVNSLALRAKEGYAGHFVLVTSCLADTITVQDPGLPPAPDCSVSHSTFLKAWTMANMLTIATT
jgi:hypothetical protein